MLPIHTRKLHVTTMVLPILEYASIVWGDKNNAIKMNSIQILQNKASKLILDRAPHSSSSDVMDHLKWLDLSHRRHLNRCIFMYKTVNGDSEISKYFTRGLDTHNYDTRQKNNLRTIKSSTKSVNCCINDWNALPIEIRSLPTISCFKAAILSSWSKS